MQHADHENASKQEGQDIGQAVIVINGTQQHHQQHKQVYKSLVRGEDINAFSDKPIGGFVGSPRDPRGTFQNNGTWHVYSVIPMSK